MLGASKSIDFLKSTRNEREALHDTNVEIVLQRDLNTLIKAEELANEPRDISWLREQIKTNIFDLYCLLSIDDRKYCFGCVQAKTSIRDRVTRDREPSIHAILHEQGDVAQRRFFQLASAFPVEDTLVSPPSGGVSFEQPPCILVENHLA